MLKSLQESSSDGAGVGVLPTEYPGQKPLQLLQVIQCYVRGEGSLACADRVGAPFTPPGLLGWSVQYILPLFHLPNVILPFSS